MNSPAHNRTVADRFAPFGTTVFAEISALANEHGAINLGQGFPDFDGPPEIMDAAHRAMRDGHNQYAPLTGIAPLRESIAASYADRFGLSYDAGSGITVTSGCTEAIAATLTGLVNPGEEVVLFEPFYDSYRACVALAGAVPRFVTLRPSKPGGRFTFDPEELANACSKKTAAILINTPHNPTGTIFTPSELDTIGELCVRHNAIAISDEVYEHITFDRPHTPIATRPGMRDRTVTLSSLGKTFSLTGWKIGWAAAPADLTKGVRAAHQYLTFAVATPLQHAAVAALDSPGSYYTSLRDQYRERRDLLLAALARTGFRCTTPEGGYFIMADHTPLSTDGDVAFAQSLIEDIGVAAIPPSFFYANPEHGRGFTRFAFCKKKKTLDRAIERLEKIRTEK